jgi:hypothetical protein
MKFYRITFQGGKKRMMPCMDKSQVTDYIDNSNALFPGCFPPIVKLEEITFKQAQDCLHGGSDEV